MADERILIVDDDVDLVGALTAALTSAGYRVSSAGNGRVGWEKAQESPPDLAILDVVMDTVGEGIQLAHRFRNDEKLKSVPIIMLTAVNQKLPLKIGADLDEGYLPVDQFLEKPVDPGVLLGFIAGLLARRRGR